MRLNDGPAPTQAGDENSAHNGETPVNTVDNPVGSPDGVLPIVDPVTTDSRSR